MYEDISRLPGLDRNPDQGRHLAIKFVPIETARGRFGEWISGRKEQPVIPADIAIPSLAGGVILVPSPESGRHFDRVMDNRMPAYREIIQDRSMSARFIDLAALAVGGYYHRINGAERPYNVEVGVSMAQRMLHSAVDTFSAQISKGSGTVTNFESLYEQAQRRAGL